MAPPPAKRQKRLVVLSSDDDEVLITPSIQQQATKTGKGSRDSRSISSNGAAEHILPSRSRVKTTEQSKLKSKPSKTTQANVKCPPELFTQRLKSVKKEDVPRSISTFFTAGGFGQNPKPSEGRQYETLGPDGVPEDVGEDEVEDLIEDDSPVERVDSLQARQTTIKHVLDRRKRLLGSTYNDIAQVRQAKLLNASQKFKDPGPRGANDSSVHKLATLGNVDRRPWSQRFGPVGIEELAVHKKKVSGVRMWIESALSGRDHKRLLILRGPSGAGKTATIVTLAMAMGVDLSEWKNPVGSDYSSEGYVSMSARFEEFLGRSGRFNKLETSDSADSSVQPTAEDAPGATNTRKVILLEEYPSTCLSASSALRSFRSGILEFLASDIPSTGAFYTQKTSSEAASAPLVMIITETRLTAATTSSDSFTAHRLLGADILSHPGVSVIDFNPVAPTFLTKALDLVVQKEARQSGRRRIPGPSVLQKLGEVGDVRSAIGSLEFLCLREGDGDEWGGRGAAKINRGAAAGVALTKIEKESLETVTQRESSLGLFHAVGKVVYNKRDDTTVAKELVTQPPEHLSEQGRPRVSQVSVDQLIDETGTDPRTFIAALHENYVTSTEGNTFTNTLNGCLDALSDSDLLGSSSGGRFVPNGDFGGRSFQGAASDSLRREEIAFQLAVRGLLFSLPHPVKRASHPVNVAGKRGGKGDAYKMFYPTSMKLSRQKEEVEALVDRWTNRLRAATANLIHPVGDRRRQFHGLRSKAGERGLGPGETHPLEAEQQSSESFRISLNCTKTELILERLPYITKIEHARLSPAHLRELGSVTQFHGIDAPSDETSEDENIEAMPFSAEAKASFLASAVGLEKDWPDVGQEKEALGALAVVEEVGKLYLSDDDIEDD